MFNVSNNIISMTEGDWGIKLPITVSGTTFAANDELRFTVGEVAKTYTNIQNNTIDFELTDSETELLPVGVYAYSLDWYQDGAFMCNIIPSGLFKVVDKA